MEKASSHKITLGIFVCIGLLIFILTVYFIGNKQNRFGSSYLLKTSFNNTNGLQIGNNVRYSGIQAGTVQSIQMLNDTSIQVEMKIHKSVFLHLKKDAIATIGSDGLVGNKIINIFPGKGNPNPVESGDWISSINQLRSEDMLTTLNITNKNAAILTANLINITNEILKGKGTIGSLLNDTTLSNDLSQILTNLKKTTENTSKSALKIDQLITSLDNKNTVIGAIKDSSLTYNLRSTIKHLNQTSVELNQAVSNLNATILNIKEGKGAINYLTNNPQLVHQIDSTISNLNSASIKLNENLEAFKHSFLLRGYFKNQEKKSKIKK
jgi:phospholipid/cholesterol/gamma-HCH transport system substrate-binding protein